LFHFLDDERISFRQRSITSIEIIAVPYCGRPGVVFKEIAFDEIALEDPALAKILDEILLSNIGTP
jgi:hypothetical protein